MLDRLPTETTGIGSHFSAPALNSMAMLPSANSFGTESSAVLQRQKGDVGQSWLLLRTKWRRRSYYASTT